MDVFDLPSQLRFARFHFHGEETANRHHHREYRWACQVSTRSSPSIQYANRDVPGQIQTPISLRSVHPLLRTSKVQSRVGQACLLQALRAHPRANHQAYGLTNDHRGQTYGLQNEHRPRVRNPAQLDKQSLGLPSAE